MLLSSIQSLFRNQLSVDDFRAGIKDEIIDYKAKLNKKGASNPIFLNEDIHYDLTEADVAYLLNLTRTGKLNLYEASYIADSLLLSNNLNFITEDLITKLEYLTIDNE